MVVLLAALADATPSPSPSTPDDNLVTPGPWGFTAIAFIAIAVIVLIFDMMRRIRRGRYRADIREELDAEEESRREGDAAARTTEIDDQDIDPADDPAR